MSLQWSLSREVPADTAAIGRAILPMTNLYRQIGDRFHELFPEEHVFQSLYEETGRGAISPLLLALVTVFQMIEKLPDRLAAEYVASRLDWKYALHLPLTYPGFHFTDLYAFRVRLPEHGQERLLFDQLLATLESLGMLKRRGKMRTDSTALLALVHRLTQLDLIRESIRVALRAMREVAPGWAQAQLPPAFHERYQERQSEFGLSKEQAGERLQEAGQDGFWFLAQLDASAPQELRDLSEVQTLRTVLAQQFPQGPQEPAAKRPRGEDVIESPHEPEARLGVKRNQGWTGYKTQVTESCEDDLPHLVLDIGITGALENDSPALPGIQERLAAQGTPPGEQWVDQGYMSAENVVQSAEQGIDLVGVPLGDTQGAPGFRQEAFVLDEAAQQATCPMGEKSRIWREVATSEGHPPAIYVRFASTSCRACVHFGVCTTSSQGRTLTLHPYREVLWARREEAKTEAYRERLHRRAGIEATISELVRGYGLRKARYRGQRKTQLQAYFTAIAINLKRLYRWWQRKEAVQLVTPAATC